MDLHTIKQKIINGSLTDEELSKLLREKDLGKEEGGFLKTLFKGVSDTYTTPIIWRLILEIALLLVVIIGVIILTYTGKMEAWMAAVLFAFVLGFLIGKIK